MFKLIAESQYECHHDLKFRGRADEGWGHLEFTTAMAYLAFAPHLDPPLSQTINFIFFSNFKMNSNFMIDN